MTDLSEYAKREGMRVFQLPFDERGHTSTPPTMYAQGILHLAARLAEEDVIEAGAKAISRSIYPSATGNSNFWEKAARESLAAMLAKVASDG